ncbi:unnamed protein product [Miscanthus lutarioriparius]|uniref:Uncharacterized protein n=1 Tax=Miscanthus lutarioriparius TaxID=422564 RepID=A0A811QCG2_9POAL|nr:unnamed protein product [Miscanthus lutarioriparius]
MRNVYQTSAIFLILMIICSTTPSCQGQDQPQVAHGPRPARPPEPPFTPVPHPPKPPGPPFTPVPDPPSPPGPPFTPVPHPPGWIPPHSLLQAEQPHVVGGYRPAPRPPMPPKPPMPPRPPRPPPHSLLEAEAKSETCYHNNNKLSPTGCVQMSKKNGFKTKHSYYIERQDAKWECCCPH